MAIGSVISGTGSWTVVTPADATIDVFDPPTKNPILGFGTPVPDADIALFPYVTLIYTLTADGTSVVNVIGDDSTHMPDPVDAIGYTANTVIEVVNDTGHDITGLTFSLTNENPDLPYNLGSSVIHYGEADYDANYAYFTMVQPVDGLTTTLLTPTGAVTTAAGAAPSEMVLTGDIAQGATVTSDMVIHNTELTAPANNDFSLSVTDAPAVVVAPPPPPPPPPMVTPPVVTSLPVIASVLLQDSNGTDGMWQLNGPTFVGGGVIGSNTGPSWHIKGAAPFYGAGSNGILWQNDDGAVAMWQMNGTTAIGGAVVATNPGPTWHIEGYGDFYNDGHQSILWQNDNGAVALWDMNGTTPVTGAVLANPGPTWHVEGNGDFYGDGHQTILFQNDNGAVAMWDMSGTNFVDAGVVAANPGPTWHIKGTGDFYGDGNTDILWQNDNGSVALWDMSGTNIIAAAVVNSAPGPTWHVEGTGDYNGDGKTDIMFQNDNGSVAVWEMNGTNIAGGGLVGNPGTGWSVSNDQMQFIQDSSANLTASAVSQDEFVFLNPLAGASTISGFNPVQDIIELNAAKFATFADVQAATTTVAGGAMINLGNGSSLSLPGVNPASLHASDFSLA